MPLNASIRCFTLFYTLLATRFPAAENPLRIPKVLQKAAQSRTERCLKYTVLHCFIDLRARYPC